ncbi:unnamed protein product [Camellia sinensis]
MDSKIKSNKNTNKNKKEDQKLNLKPDLEQIHTSGMEEENPAHFYHGGKKNTSQRGRDWEEKLPKLIWQKLKEKMVRQ